MTSIGIFGARGRMGQAIAQAAAEAGLDVAGGTNGFDGGTIGAQDAPITTDPAGLAEKADILIDFSVPAALKINIAACIAAEKPLLIGTTGLAAAHHELIDEAAKSIAVLQTGNTSLGVNLLAALVREAAQRLGDDWDIEIVEMHHRHKVDAPSGTALLLGEAAAKGRNIALADHSARGRDGMTGPRQAGDIGFAALRGGSVAGDHMVILASEGERIELGHRAENRFIFAKGAIKAAQWLIGRAPGRYSMADVLGL
jgi:4-hydroxy-tetrahydrodipicolinate reductase